MKPKSTKFFVFRILIICILFISVLALAWILKWPDDFDSYVYIENYKFSAHLNLVIYRTLQYFTFPFILSLFDVIKYKVKFKDVLVENFNIQFLTYSIMTGLWTVFGIDKLLDIEIFGSSDIFLFVTGFVVTLIIEKKFLNLLDINHIKENE